MHKDKRIMNCLPFMNKVYGDKSSELTLYNFSFVSEEYNRIENEINLRFLMFSCFSCYLWSRCVLRNFDMKSW